MLADHAFPVASLQAARQRRGPWGAEGWPGALGCWLGWGGAQGGRYELLASRALSRVGALPGGSGSVHPALHVLINSRWWASRT